MSHHGAQTSPTYGSIHPTILVNEGVTPLDRTKWASGTRRNGRGRGEVLSCSRCIPGPPGPDMFQQCNMSALFIHKEQPLLAENVGPAERSKSKTSLHWAPKPTASLLGQSARCLGQASELPNVTGDPTDKEQQPGPMDLPTARAEWKGRSGDPF